MTDKDKKIFIKFGLWLGFLILVIVLGISNVFADEIIDTSSWINVTGRNWSLTGQEYYTGTQNYNNNWLINHYNVTGGIYTPPTDFDYITYSFFQHSGSVYNPCNNGKYTAEFDILMENSSFVQYVSSVKWAGKECNISKDTSNGHIHSTCIFDPNNSNITTIRADLNPISGTNATNIYISRNIDISCGINTEAIIDNATQNTQNIINNNNSNTQYIINNQNENTQQEIESQKVCQKKTIDRDTCIGDGWLNVNGTTTDNTSGSCYTDFIQLNDGDTLDISTVAGTNDYYCFYNENKTLISCNNFNNVSGTLNIPTNAKYFRSTIKANNKPVYILTYCINGNQAIAEQNQEAEETRKGIFKRLGELISTLFSNDDADISGLNNMVGWLPPGPLDSIINLPLNLFNSLTNVLSGTCNSVTLTIPFVNQQLVLPCFDTFMSQYLTGFSTIWTFVGVTVSVFILYNYLLTLYKWVDDTLTLRENNLPGYYDDNWGGGA